MSFYQFTTQWFESFVILQGFCKVTMKTWCLVAFAALAALATPAAAENPLHAALGSPDGLVIRGSFRSRVEAIEGQFRPTAAVGDSMLSFRTTLFAEAGSGPLRIGGEIFDSRAYFQAANSSAATSEVNALELAQAYVAYDLGDAMVPGSKARITAGRFTMDISSRRLVARNAFRNTANAFTGVRFDWTGQGGTRAVVFWTMPHTRLPNDPQGIRQNRVEFDRENPSLQLFGGNFAHGGILGGTAELYGYGLLERDAPGFRTTNRRLFTPGLRFFVAAKPGRFDHDIEFAYQLGTARATNAASDSRDLDVSAWFLRAEIGRSFTGGLNPRLAIIYDHASGDGANPQTLNRFDTLFGARRSDYGPSALYGVVARANLISPSLKLEIAPNARIDAAIAWRPLWLASATDSFSGTGIRDTSGHSGRFAGHQVEARLRYWLVPKLVRLDTGAALLAKSDFLRKAPNARDIGDTHYGYFDINVEF
jgi:hypothetical protein